MWHSLFLALLALLAMSDYAEGGFINNRGGRDGKNRKGRVKGIDSDDVDVSDFKVKGSRKHKVKVNGGGEGGKKVHKVKLNQYYRKVPIYGASIVVEYEEEDVDETDPFVDFGVYYENKYIQQYVQSVHTNLDDAALREIIAEDLGRDNFTSTCEQWIYFVALVPYNAFICNVVGEEGGGAAIVPGGDEPNVYHWQYVIDANQGTVLEKVNQMNSALKSDLSGNAKMGQTTISRDSITAGLENADVVLRDCNHGTSCSTTLSCQSSADCEPSTKDVNGGTGIAMLAYEYTTGVFDCYRELTGEPPLDFQVPVRVHYSSNYENAFWDGSSITFGDGASTFYPLVCADVVGHELAHGFTSSNSDLQYFGESGGVNEAYSDLAGVACAAWIKGQTVDWRVGADMFKAEGLALRYMNNPPQDGSSIDHFGDYHSSMDVHYSSGVLNKAFYNMVQNGVSVNDVFKVASLANKLYWTAQSTMMQAADALVNAAHDLGVDSGGHAIVDAITAVGLVCLDDDCSPSTDSNSDSNMELDPSVPQSPQQIVGGTPATAEQFPFIVSLRHYTDVHLCGGSILRKQYPAMILTAAHCTGSLRPYYLMTVRLYSSDQDAPFDAVSNNYYDATMSRRPVNHPQYNDRTFYNDVAVIWLEDDLSGIDRLSEVQIRRNILNLGSGDECCAAGYGDALQVIGYGDTSEGGEISDTLEYVDVTYVPRSSCRAELGVSSIGDTENCAIESGKDACQGDSGGPLVRAGTTEQVGVVSWGLGCDRGYPGVYADVGSPEIYDWIMEQMSLAAAHAEQRITRDEHIAPVGHVRILSWISNSNAFVLTVAVTVTVSVAVLLLSAGCYRCTRRVRAAESKGSAALGKYATVMESDESDRDVHVECEEDLQSI